MPTITPKRAPGKSFFRVTFRNPRTPGKVVTASLQTDEEDVAASIAADIEKLCLMRELWQEPDSPRLAVYHPRAVEVFFGMKASLRSEPRLSNDEVGTAAARVAKVLGVPAQVPKVEAILRTFETKKYREMFQQAERDRGDKLALKSQLETVTAELDKMHRAANKHVKVQTRDAFNAFKIEYPKGHARGTVAVVLNWVEDFIQVQERKERKLLGLLRAEHVNEWLSDMRTEPDAEGITRDLKPATKQRRKMYLSSFFSWCCERYDLAENPVQNAMTIAGATRKPEMIEALSLEEIRTLLKSLKDETYWRAWVAFACLAGPRWGEQVALPIDAVNLNDRYVTIRAAKTARQRRVPIESTTLLPILKEFMMIRAAEHKNGSTASAKSNWLFPSTLEEKAHAERKVTPMGQWSGPRAFHDAWERLIPKGREGDHVWKFGPREWRHTFGTALGQAGMSGIEIARMMGNSPTVADAHYVAVTEAGRRWPFKW